MGESAFGVALRHLEQAEKVVAFGVVGLASQQGLVRGFGLGEVACLVVGQGEVKGGFGCRRRHGGFG